MNQPLEYFDYQKGLLSAGSVEMETIAREFGTPVYVYSEQGLLQSLNSLQEGLRDQGIDATVCFAVKANPNISLLRLLTRAGAGLDLVSGGELDRAMHLGLSGTRVIFSGVGKTEQEMKQALAFRDGEGIHSFNVESFQELELLNRIGGELGERVRVSLRFNPDVDAKTHPYISTGLKQNKFGMDRREIERIVQRIVDFKDFRNIRILGLSMHIGSQMTTLSPIRAAFGKLTELALKLELMLPEPLELLDLGGGLGVSYEPGRPLPGMTTDAYCRLVGRFFGPRSALVKKRGRAFRIFMEPGRMIAANAGLLLTRVLYRKKHHNKIFVIVDAAMNDLMRPALYGSRHAIVPTTRSVNGKKPKTTRCDIVGPVCETSDCFARGVELPENVGPGDLLAILSSGAYGHSMSNTYNCRCRPPEVLISKSIFKSIRRRETFEDLLRTESD